MNNFFQEIHPALRQARHHPHDCGFILLILLILHFGISANGMIFNEVTQNL